MNHFKDPASSTFTKNNLNFQFTRISIKRELYMYYVIVMMLTNVKLQIGEPLKRPEICFNYKYHIILLKESTQFITF